MEKYNPSGMRCKYSIMSATVLSSLCLLQN